MNKMCQQENEDPQTFVLRSIQVRESIMNNSLAEGGIRYDRGLVNSLFLHTVRTGLRDDSVKARLEPLLEETAKTPDEILLAKVNVIASEEVERKTKRGESVKKKIVVSEAHATDSSELDSNAPRSQSYRKVAATVGADSELADSVKQL